MKSLRWLWIVIIIVLGSSIVFAAGGQFLNRPLSGENLKLTYLTKGDRVEGIETRERIIYKNKDALLVRQKGPNLNKELYIEKESMTPLYFNSTEKINGMINHVEINFSDRDIQLTVDNGKHVIKKVFLKKPNETIYPVDQFAVLLANMDYVDGKPVIFKGLFYQSPYIADMVFKLEGKENIHVHAGELEAYKLRLTLPGLAAVFFKSYFWVSVDDPHYLVRYQGKQYNQNVETDLVKVEKPLGD